MAEAKGRAGSSEAMRQVTRGYFEIFIAFYGICSSCNPVTPSALLGRIVEVASDCP